MDVKALMRHATRGGTAVGHYRGFLPEVVSEGIGAGASELTGFLVGKYHDDLARTRVPVPLVAGAALKAGAILLDVMSRGRSTLSHTVLHPLGSAGINAFFVLDGVARGYASANKQLYSGSRKDPKLAAAGARAVDRLWGQPQTSVGHIPQAPEGQWFDEGGLRHFANR